MRKSKIKSPGRSFVWIIFPLYLILLFSLLLFKRIPLLPPLPGLSPATFTEEVYVNTDPLNSIRMYRSALHNSWGGSPDFFNLFGNILCFFPFGFLAPFLCRVDKPWFWRCLWAGVFCSILIEWIQLMTGLGVWDIDDILLNSLGLLLGLLFSWPLKYYQRK